MSVCFVYGIIRLFLETSGSPARSTLRWVRVRQKKGGRGFAGSVNQNNTLSWCEIRLTTTLQIWIRHSHIHSRLTLLLTRHCYLDFAAIFSIEGLLCFAHIPVSMHIFTLPFVCPSIHTLPTPSLSCHHSLSHTSKEKSVQAYALCPVFQAFLAFQLQTGILLTRIKPWSSDPKHITEKRERHSGRERGRFLKRGSRQKRKYQETHLYFTRTPRWELREEPLSWYNTKSLSFRGFGKYLFFSFSWRCSCLLQSDPLLCTSVAALQWKRSLRELN